MGQRRLLVHRSVHKSIDEILKKNDDSPSLAEYLAKGIVGRFFKVSSSLLIEGSHMVIASTKFIHGFEEGKESVKSAAADTVYILHELMNGDSENT